MRSCARSVLVYWGPYFLLGLCAAVFYLPLLGEIHIGGFFEERRSLANLGADEFVAEGIVRTNDPFIPSDEIRIQQVWQGPRLPRLDVRSSGPLVGHDSGEQGIPGLAGDITQMSRDEPVTFSAALEADGWKVTGVGYSIEELNEHFGPASKPQRLVRAPQLVAGWQILAVIALLGMLHRLRSDPTAKPRSRSVVHGLRRGGAVGGAVYGAFRLGAVIADMDEVGPIGVVRVVTQEAARLGERLMTDGYLATAADLINFGVTVSIPLWVGAPIGATVGYYLAHAVHPALKHTPSRLAWVGVGAFGGLLSVWLFETTLVFTTWLWTGLLVGAGAGWLGRRLARTDRRRHVASEGVHAAHD